MPYIEKFVSIIQSKEERTKQFLPLSAEAIATDHKVSIPHPVHLDPTGTAPAGEIAATLLFGHDTLEAVLVSSLEESLAIGLDELTCLSGVAGASSDFLR